MGWGGGSHRGRRGRPRALIPEKVGWRVAWWKGGGCKGFGSEGVGGRDTGPRDGANFASYSNAYKKKKNGVFVSSFCMR